MANRGLLVFACIALLSACAWVKVSPEGEKVRVLTEAGATNCKKTGETTVSLRDKVAGVKRGSEKVRTELETLARNAAPDLNGNAVIATTEAVDGKQTFAVYQCK